MTVGIDVIAGSAVIIAAMIAVGTVRTIADMTAHITAAGTAVGIARVITVHATTVRAIHRSSSTFNSTGRIIGLEILKAPPSRDEGAFYFGKCALRESAKLGYDLILAWPAPPPSIGKV